MYVCIYLCTHVYREMRKRWQEAVTNRETLSSELGSATAPLMRQISSMQDSMRSKGEAWQVIYMYLYVYIYMYMYIQVYKCIYVYVCIFVRV
jgi:hypothetical protein